MIGTKSSEQETYSNFSVFYKKFLEFLISFLSLSRNVDALCRTRRELLLVLVLSQSHEFSLDSFSVDLFWSMRAVSSYSAC